MFRNYLKIAVRNLLQNRMYTALNFFGLSLGITCALVIYMLVRYYLSFDNFHRESAQIYRIVDRKAVLLLMRVLKEMLCGIKVILADGGYRGEIIAEVKKGFGYIIQVVLRSDKFEKDFQPVHKRWIIERTAPAARVFMV